MKIGGYENCEKLGLYFDYQMHEGNKIEVYAISPLNETVKLGEVTIPTGQNAWKPGVFDLDAVKDWAYFRLKAVMIKGTSNGLFMGIDNIHICAKHDNNLIAGLDLVETPYRYGQAPNLKVIVENSGFKTANDFEATLYVGGKELSTQKASGLEPMHKTTLYFPCQITPAFLEENDVKVEVSIAGEANPDDNTAEGTIYVQKAKVSCPVDVHGDSNGSETNLGWSAPTEFYTENVEEGFESYEPFTITNFGAWTAIDVDKAPVDRFESAEYPNAVAPQAFTIWHPAGFMSPEEMQTLPPLCAYEGDKFLGCLAADVNTVEHNDDWFISPELSGNTQIISFMAKRITEALSPEKLHIMVSSTGKEIADFTMLEEYEITQAWPWKKYLLELPEGTKYFAFHCVSRDGYMLMIDDVKFEAGSCHDITSYRIYKNRELLDEVKYPAETYTEPSAEGGIYNITAVYATGEESDFSDDIHVKNNGVGSLFFDDDKYTVYSVDGKVLRVRADNLDGLEPGLYIVNGKKVVIK